MGVWLVFKKQQRGQCVWGRLNKEEIIINDVLEIIEGTLMVHLRRGYMLYSCGSCFLNYLIR